MATERVCSIEGCGRPHYGRGWCGAHYQRWRRHGDPEAGRLRGWNARCTVVGCDRPHLARGWCNLHYSRWKHHGDPAVVVSQQCSVCIHPLRRSIDVAALSGEALNLVAQRFRIGESTVRKHSADCLRYRPSRHQNQCKTCQHPDLIEIEKALEAGEPMAAIERRYGLRPGVLWNHTRPEHQARRIEAAAARLAAVERYVGST